jgi:hypothetical protein
MASVTDTSEIKQKWLSSLDELIQRVKTWCEAEGWVTRRIEKVIQDFTLGKYKAPVLLLQKETTRVLLEPISHSVPGADGVVDLYLMPAYDDIASLYLENGQWQLHYMFPETPPKATIREAAAEALTAHSLMKVLGEMIKNADQA